jgi:hypothetical protein
LQSILKPEGDFMNPSGLFKRLFEWLKQVSKAFWETANLVALIILVVPSVLTWDKELFGVGILVEVGYLCWASLWPSYRTQLKSQAKSAKRVVTSLDRVLLVVSIAGFIVILFFGFCKHLLSHPRPYLTHAEGWELGAIIWTAFFLVYYLFKFQVTGRPNFDKAILVLVAWLGHPLLTRAWDSRRRPIEHVTYVLAIGACFFVIDLLVALKHPNLDERDLSWASLKWADAPMVVAFSVLLGYLVLHRDTENPDVFVSGVVSCQLLISNAVFVVMEFGLLKSPKRQALVSSPIQSVDCNDSLSAGL